jgi:hypothetical protein
MCLGKQTVKKRVGEVVPKGSNAARSSYTSDDSSSRRETDIVTLLASPLSVTI